MKAMVYSRYGSFDRMKLKEIPKPVPDDNEVLIAVKASSVNPYEWRHVMADPFFIRFSSGMFKPKEPVLGADISGVVEAVGINVKLFKPGDEVFGEGHYGAYAEYATVPEDNLVHKPSGVSFGDAASAPMVCLTALQGLRDHGKISEGQSVLINGASGGIGTYAVQIAKLYKTKVTGICSTKNIDLVKKLGADEVVDYTSRQIEAIDSQFDIILDTVGNLNSRQFNTLLKPEGIAVVAGFKSLYKFIRTISSGARYLKKRNKKVTSFTAQMKKDDLTLIGSWLHDHKLIAVKDSVYLLEQLPEALKHSYTGHACGKIVIKISD